MAKWFHCGPLLTILNSVKISGKYVYQIYNMSAFKIVLNSMFVMNTVCVITTTV